MCDFHLAEILMSHSFASVKRKYSRLDSLHLVTKLIVDNTLLLVAFALFIAERSFFSNIHMLLN